MLCCEVLRKGLIDEVQALWGERYMFTATVPWILRAGDQCSALKTVEALGDSAGGDHRTCREVAGAEGVGPAGPAKGCEDVETGRVQVMAIDGPLQFSVDLPGQPR